MKILFITHKYPPIIGGMEKQSFELITRTSNLHEVIAITYNGTGSKLKWFLSLKNRIKKILDTHKDIDIIHLNDGLMATATLWLKKYTSIPVIATIHGLDITFPSSIFQKRIIPKLLNLDGIIAVSNATADACTKRNFAKEKVFVVLNGVDHDLSDIPVKPETKSQLQKLIKTNLDDKKIIITMGRAVKRKGFSWFLKNVMPSLDNNIILLMIGPLNRKISLGEKIINFLPKALATKFQLMLGLATDVKPILNALESPLLRGRVFHLGKVPFNDLMQYLAIADLFVMPNVKVKGDAEGFGLVALESSLRSTPVIAANIEGITDAIKNNKNGILLPSGAQNKWIDTIHNLLSDASKLADFSTSSKMFTLDNYSWDKMVKEYDEVFREVLSSTEDNLD